MKQVKIFIFLSVTLYVMGSCTKEFLTINPEGNLNDAIFFKSTKDFQQAVNGAYVPLRDVSNVAYLMDEDRADNARYEYDARDRGDRKSVV